MKKREECRICGFQSLYLAGSFSFMPMVCCEEKKYHERGNKKTAGLVHKQTTHKQV